MTYSNSLPTSPNVSPIFIKRPLIASVTLTNQIAARNPSSPMPVTLYTGAGAGALIESIEAMALGNNIATVLRVFYKLPLETQYRLFAEHTLPAITTASDSAALADYPRGIELPKILSPASPDPTKPNGGIRVPPGAEIAVALGTAVVSGVVVTAWGGEYS